MTYTLERSQTLLRTMTMITIQLTVTALPGAPRVPLTVNPDVTPTQLREQAASTTNIPLSSIKLIVRGRLVAANDALSAVAEYKLEEGTVLHCMGKPEEIIDSAANASSNVGNGSGRALPTVSVAAGATASAVSTSTADPLQAALTVLRTSNSPTVFQTAISTLDKILSNVIENPMEEKYRSLKVQNAAFQRRLGGLPGGNAAILACGFTIETVDSEEKYCMAASADKWAGLLATKASVAQAVLQSTPRNAPPALQNALSNAAAAAAAANLLGTGMPSFPGMMGGIPADSPEMRQAMSHLLSNPQNVHSMLEVRKRTRDCDSGHRLKTSSQFICTCVLVYVATFLSLLEFPQPPRVKQQPHAGSIAAGAGAQSDGHGRVDPLGIGS